MTVRVSFGKEVLASCTCVLLSMVGCAEVLPSDANGVGEVDARTLRLELNGLEALGSAFVYEGWLIVDGVAKSSGRFTIDADGMLSQSEFDVSVDDAEMASTFVLTIEPAENDPPEPATTHVVAGDFNGDTADLSIGHAAALGSDYSSASGSFILNTPSTADTDDDFDQGIWWLEATGEGPVASLELPVLPAGWKYEGWVVGTDGPVSTGRFIATVAADEDGAGPTGGPDGFPPFPGQDFINPPMVLVGSAAVISIEPDPDDNSAPFAIKPLVDATIDQVDIGVTQDMANMSANNPVGTAEFLTP